MTSAVPPRPPLDPSLVRSLLEAPDGPLARVEVVASTGSTNEDVVAALRADPDAWPDRSVLVADHQVAGRGRAGRTWETPAGTALTCTFVLRAPPGGRSLGWLPLVAGLGAVHALRATAGVAAALKWPNDLLVPADDELEGWGPYRKVGGILTELVPRPDGAAAVVVGVGVNVLQGPAELPVPWATSLALAGARHVDRLGVLTALVDALDEVGRRWRDAAGDVAAAGLAGEVADVCATLGARVAVDLPGGEVVTGLASRLDADGALVVSGQNGDERRVLAGDVRHLRVV
ncbi:biotin--[acetyl-CoA-carboxylase] ligase [Cellulomonas massiliensis]|uniref:biotin--[acetyl-CoA-carboxylase] ligase n=1 Tax=Cellulomonas massiliensis TaxID=1465811 RepID=UPI00030C63D8|nr:biotin--[acetyl-CoA-carboxylase] ligase [Cellulomonas massiliensis]